MIFERQSRKCRRAISIIFGIFIAVSLLFLPSCRCYGEISIHETFAQSLTSSLPTKDGSDFMQNVCDSIHQWKDYSCNSELDVFKKQGLKKYRCKLSYKDEQVRIDVQGGGYRDGTVLIKSKDGKIKARGGLMLGHMTMNLDPDSRMLILPDGSNVLKISLPTLLSDLKKKLNQNYSCRVTTTPVTIPDMPDKMYIVDVIEGQGQDQNLSKRLYVSIDQKIPVRWDIYTNGERTAAALFTNIHTNSGLSDELFDI